MELHIKVMSLPLETDHYTKAPMIYGTRKHFLLAFHESVQNRRAVFYSGTQILVEEEPVMCFSK